MFGFDYLSCVENFILHSIHQGNVTSINILLGMDRFYLQMTNDSIGDVAQTYNSTFSRQDYLENVWTCCSVDRKILVKMSSQKWKRKIVDGKWSEKQIEDLVTPGMKITIFSKETVESNRKYFDFDSLKSQIEKLISSFYLLHCDISFSFATDLSNMPLRLDRNGKINHALTAARQLFKPRTRKSVVPFHGSSHHFKIKGMVVIGDKRPTNNSFYIYVNGRLVESKDLTSYLTEGQNQPTILNIKCSRLIYRVSEFTNRIKEIQFSSHFDELISLIGSSLEISLAKSTIKTGLNENAMNIDKTLLKVPKLKRPSFGSSLWYGKVAKMDHQFMESEIRIINEIQPQIISNDCLDPFNLLSMWHQDLDGQNPERANVEVMDAVSISKDIPLTTRLPIEGSPIKPKRKMLSNRFVHSDNQFWIQHKLPPNIAIRQSRIPVAFQEQCNFNKTALSNANLINQIDRKFICCIAQEQKGKHCLVLIDQHAAHERICLERLMQIHSVKDEHGHVLVQSSPVHPHLQLTMPSEDLMLVSKLSAEFERFGLHVTVNEAMVNVSRVPTCFLAREANEVKRKRESTYGGLVTTLIEETLSEFRRNARISSCLLPVPIRNVLNSLACRGAIKFGDLLSMKQCSQLMRALSQCDVPFQCAHGRPLLTPLLELNRLESAASISSVYVRPNYARLRNQIMSTAACV